MAWKIERWMAEVFPGDEEMFHEYNGLPDRELAIVTGAVLDVALAELLYLRLGSYPKEAEEFLGINGDGRAPAGSFGARIQLALLTGLIEIDTAVMLRRLKALRNVCAHRVKIDFRSDQIVKMLVELMDSWIDVSNAVIARGGVIKGVPDYMEKLKQLRAAVPESPEAGRAALLMVFIIGQGALSIKYKHVKPIR